MDDNGKLFCSLVFGSALKFSMLYWTRNNREKRCAGQVSAIYVHPVKSCRALRVPEANLTPLGLEFSGVVNRMFFVVDKDNVFINLKAEPSMTLIKPEIVGNNLELHAPNMTPVVIPKHIVSGKIVSCSLHGVKVKAIDCGDEAGLWLSKFLKQDGIRLVTGVDYQSALTYNEVTYGGKYPYMLMSEASVEDLNSNLEEKNSVSVRNFRANIVVKGSAAFDEDRWEEIFIGNAHFKKSELCTRCVITNVDPETGDRNPENQPMQMLKRHRMKEGDVKPCVGLYMVPSRLAKIHVGDVVYVRKETEIS